MMDMALQAAGHSIRRGNQRATTVPHPTTGEPILVAFPRDLLNFHLLVDANHQWNLTTLPNGQWLLTSQERDSLESIVLGATAHARAECRALIPPLSAELLEKALLALDFFDTAVPPRRVHAPENMDLDIQPGEVEVNVEKYDGGFRLR